KAPGHVCPRPRRDPFHRRRKIREGDLHLRPPLAQRPDDRLRHQPLAHRRRVHPDQRPRPVPRFHGPGLQPRHRVAAAPDALRQLRTHRRRRPEDRPDPPDGRLVDPLTFLHDKKLRSPPARPQASWVAPDPPRGTTAARTPLGFRRPFPRPPRYSSRTRTRWSYHDRTTTNGAHARSTLESPVVRSRSRRTFSSRPPGPRRERKEPGTTSIPCTGVRSTQRGPAPGSSATIRARMRDAIASAAGSAARGSARSRSRRTTAPSSGTRTTGITMSNRHPGTTSDPPILTSASARGATTCARTR